MHHGANLSFIVHAILYQKYSALYLLITAGIAMLLSRRFLGPMKGSIWFSVLVVVFYTTLYSCASQGPNAASTVPRPEEVAARVYYLECIESLQRGETSRAKILASNWIAHDERPSLAWTLLGTAYLEEGKELEAEDSFYQAIRIDRGNADAYALCAASALRRGDLQKASLVLAEGDSVCSENALFQLTQGELLLRAEKFQAAEARLLRAIDLRPSLSEAYDALLECYVAIGDRAAYANVYQIRLKVFKE
jgi:tetratricopeptide (TPR) repeat protein